MGHMKDFEIFSYSSYKAGQPVTLPDNKYGVSVQVATPKTGDMFVKLIGIRHLPCGQNGGNHNIHVTLLDPFGEWYKNPSTGSLPYASQQSFAGKFDVLMDKPKSDEFMCSFPMWANAGEYTTWIEHLGPNLTMEYFDTVLGIRSTYPDECGDVTYGHHSFQLVFVVDEASDGGIDPPDIEPEPCPELPNKFDASISIVTNIGDVVYVATETVRFKKSEE